jgi:hypothetical protein
MTPREAVAAINGMTSPGGLGSASASPAATWTRFNRINAAPAPTISSMVAIGLGLARAGQGDATNRDEPGLGGTPLLLTGSREAAGSGPISSPSLRTRRPTVVPPQSLATRLHREHQRAEHLAPAAFQWGPR